MRRLARFGLFLVICGCSRPSQTRLVVAATTSLEDTGMLDYLAGEFHQAHPEIELAPIAVGTGQALQLGRRGDADVLITHDSSSEEQLVSEGSARVRMSLMHNDFVIAGPDDDPAGVRGSDAIGALRAIARTGAPFISRGDDSGTHRRERQLWQQARIVPDGRQWYVEAGLGQGDALVLAGQKRAYVLSDRATFLRFKPRISLEVLSERDELLINSYGVTVMRGERENTGMLFARWLVSPRTQQLIGSFGRGEFGESFFSSSAHGAAPHDTIPTGER